jgi:hypothetical protein
MNMRDPEFVAVRVTDAAWGCRTLKASSFDDAFDRLGIRGSRWCNILDCGDRLVVEELRRCGSNPDRWSAVFHVEGVLHVPAAVVLELYRLRIARKKPVMAWEVEGFRDRPVMTSKWSRQGVFGSPRIGCERRANIGMRGDDEMADYGLSPRPCRRLVRGYRFERPKAKDANWKRFRKTQWRDRD